MTAAGNDSLAIVLANEAAEVRRAIVRIEAFARQRGVPQRTVHRFCLALDEVLTNVISYAFPDGGRHEIEVGIEIRGDRLTAIISDDGAPFDPLSQPPPDIHAALEKRKVGGLGIHLLRSLANAAEYRREGGRNRLSFSMTVGAVKRSGPS